MRVGLLRIELRVRASRSLKEKRRVVKSLLAQLQNRFGCAVAEVEYQNLQQRAALGAAVVAPDGRFLGERLQALREFLLTQPDCEILDLCQTDVPGPDPFGQPGAGWTDPAGLAPLPPDRFCGDEDS